MPKKKGEEERRKSVRQESRRRDSTRTKKSDGACGSTIDSYSEDQRRITPIIVRKNTENDFRVFSSDVRNRIKGDKKYVKKDIIEKRDYDNYNKFLPASQPLTPLAINSNESDLNEGQNSYRSNTSTDCDTVVANLLDHHWMDTSAPNKKSAPLVEQQDPASLSTKISSVPVQGNEDPVLTFQPTEIATKENLPTYTYINKVPKAPYKNILPDIFTDIIDKIYEEMIKWKKNLFMLPTGKNGKEFIKLTSEWLNHFNNDSAFQGIALKVVMVLPNLLLQKPSATSKTKEHSKALEDRLERWNKGKFGDILCECRSIQKKLKSRKGRTQEDITRIFSRLVLEGKISAALKFLEENSENAVLNSSQEVIEKLKTLHPKPAEIQSDALLQGPIMETPPTYFNSINEEAILKAANRVNGSGGPSQMDAKQWRWILVSKHFKTEGKDLRQEIATFTIKIATQVLDPHILQEYTACRSIPINKSPGEPGLQVRPIGVGEVLRRISGKAIAWALNDDIQEAGGPLQVSTGLSGGAEAAIHAMRDAFQQESTDAVILVDAENAFNKLNRKVALHNIRYLCPAFATIIINTYRIASRLFIAGGGEIPSAEGTTQGDTLAMAFYGISITPIITRLQFQQTNVLQVWLADDATGAGTIRNLREWWDKIITEGKKFGYHVKPSKSWLILKDPLKQEEAETLFAESPISITIAGKRHLGAALGSEDFKKSYMEAKVSEWCENLKKLSEIAKSQPQAAYSAYILGEQHKYTYFLRTLDNIEEILQPLDNVITDTFIPALFGSSISENEREIFSLPIKEGGLGLRIPSENASISYNASRKITAPLTLKITLQSNSLPSEADVKQSRSEVMPIIREAATERSKKILEKQTNEMTRNLEQLAEPGVSSWLGALPLKEQGFGLNKSEFQDALNIRYDKPLKNLPSKCPCNQNFDITHAMNCHRGGFVNARHDKIRNFEANLLKDVCKDVQLEPPLQPINGVTFHRTAIVNDEARLDVRARGFWRTGQNAFFDIRITNADSASQRDKPVKSILKKHEQEKKRNYNARVMEIEQGTFTPIVLTVKGVMGQEGQLFHKALAEQLSNKTGEKYEDITRLIRIKISFIVLKSALLCIRGSRSLNNYNIEKCEDFSYSLNELGVRGK